MTTSVMTRRGAAARILGALSATGLLLRGQDDERSHNLVARIQQDLERAAEFTRANDKERDRYKNVQRKLSEFDRELHRGKFDKDKLDDVIEDLNSVVKHNTLETHDRDALSQDLEDLRVLRAKY